MGMVFQTEAEEHIRELNGHVVGRGTLKADLNPLHFPFASSLRLLAVSKIGSIYYVCLT